MIYIDMPMPKCCDECFALDESGDYPYCLISHDQYGYTFPTRKKRMLTCPLKPQESITGETSDGYHTFNELYHHRAVLFSVIVANYPERAWKSKKHHDGTMYDGMFIVGIDTPDGQATYHYDVDPYWDMFKCRVLDNAPEWDGHTPSEAIERIGKLKAQELRYTPREVRNALRDYGQHDLNIKLGEVIKYDPVQVEDILMNEREATKAVTPHMVDWGIYECPECKTRLDTTYNYCKCCGRAITWE